MTNAKRADVHAVAPSPDPVPSTPTPLTGNTSPGVLRMEHVARHLTPTTRAVLLGGIFVVASVYSLDVTLRYANQPTALSLVLVPLTLVDDAEASWHRPHTIASPAVGMLCVPVLIAWESKARHPMMHLLKDRMAWDALGIIASKNCAAAVQGDYLYTVLVTSFNQSVLSATRITSLYSFVASITGLLFGAVVYKIRRLKWIIVTGTCLHFVALGLLIQFRGGSDGNYSGMVGAEVLLGASCGLFTYAIFTSIQAVTWHEQLALITGVYSACFNVGGAIGNAISGAILTQFLPGELNRQLATFGDEMLAGMTHDAPFTTIEEYLLKTSVREAVLAGYRHTQKILSTSVSLFRWCCLPWYLATRVWATNDPCWMQRFMLGAMRMS